MANWRPPFTFNMPFSSAVKAEPIDGPEPTASTSGTTGPVAEDGTKLISVKYLLPKYQAVFIHRFPYFNVVQSKVFDDVFHTEPPKSIALCAPTSSGKTVVFELAIIKQLMELESNDQSVHDLKVVYMAPLKKLVDEKFKEFRDSFNRFGLNCLQFTGDSDIEDYSVLATANIVLTTPEKWDSMVRVNRNGALVRNTQLMLIDEIHSIGDDSRGATMEAVISRMKTLRSVLMRESAGTPRLRFIAVSATAPNVKDIAHWLDPIDSIGHNLSVNCRPVRIQTIVMGFPCQEGVSEYKFDINLNYKIDTLIRSHCDSKPTLIFCSTRKSVEMCAKQLSKNSYFNNPKQRQTLSDTLRRLVFKDKNLRTYLDKGIGFHHSGLELRDRQNVEKLFVDNMVPVLVSTTTLSMGVNLPAHLVIIKNTVQFESNAQVKEYPATQVMQMIGRAGRPQFDTSAVAVIMTKSTKKLKYDLLLNGSMIIESKLHEHLTEHLNAEISLRTVTSVDIAVDWIRSTFLYIRLLQNPQRYSSANLQIPSISNVQQGLQVLREWCHKELDDLKSAEMITSDTPEFDHISSTAFGLFMARHCISFQTMRNFIQAVNGELELIDVINLICKTQELNNEIQLRVYDKKFLNEMNASKEQCTIRFPFSGKIKSTDMKISCLIQATFGSLTITDNTLSQEAMRVLRTGQRLSRCLSDIIYLKVQQKVDRISYKTLLNILIANKCFKAKLWHDSLQVIKQMPRIGNQYSKSIMSSYKNFQELKRANPRDIEFVCGNRKSPFGTQVTDWVKRLPYYSLTLTQIKAEVVCKPMVRVTVVLENFEDLRKKELINKSHSVYIIVGNDANQLFYCQQVFDTKLLKTDGKYRVDVMIEKSPQNKVYAHLISDSFVGLDVRCTLTVEFAADTHSPPEPSRTNCSTAYSDVSCEPESKPPVDASEGCQHKCANKALCRHPCCKKGLIGADPTLADGQTATGQPSQTETKSQGISKYFTQNTQNKRNLNSKQNSEQNSKRAKSGSGQPVSNLYDWLLKAKKENNEADNRSATTSKYFGQYSQIPDNDLGTDFDWTEFDTDFDTELTQTDNRLEAKDRQITETKVKQEVDDELADEFEDEFDDEFGAAVEKMDVNQLLQCNEDFQNFDDSVDALRYQVKTEATEPIQFQPEAEPEAESPTEDVGPYSSIFNAERLGIDMRFWGHVYPPNCEGKTFYNPNAKWPPNDN